MSYGSTRTPPRRSQASAPRDRIPPRPSSTSVPPRRPAPSRPSPRRRPAAPEVDHRKRIIGLFVVLVLALAAVAVRLVMLQGLRAERYRTLASNQRVTEAVLPALRGSIYDRNMSPLALSVERSTVVADPRQIRDPLLAAQRLAPVLREEPGVILPRLEGDRAFSYVARVVDDAVAEQVKALAIPGIRLVPETQRSYPAGATAGAVLGITGIDGQGLEGLEYRYDDVLRGKPGRVVEERDPDGRPIPQAPSVYERSVPGRSVQLTLDEALQFQVESILDAGVKRYNAAGGTAVVMDPATGEVLALANSPGFHPGEFAKVPTAHRRNRAVTDVFEPGSTNKVITVAAALEEKVITPTQRLEVPDEMEVADEVFADASSHPPQQWTVEDILVQSSNIGTIKVAQAVGGRRLDRYFGQFGYGHTTGIDFPGEAEGIVVPYDQWSGTSIGTIPLGQGIAASALQMTLVYATLANDGVRPVPSLVKGVASPDGRLERPPSSDVWRRTSSSATGGEIRRMLARVVSDGTGKRAAVEGYTVAGKTGTARIPGPNGYTNAYVASFVGFAPAESPRLVVSVFLDQPTPIFGGDTAAPVFSEIAWEALRHLKIPPESTPGRR